MRFNNHAIFRWSTEPWFGFCSPQFEPAMVDMLKSVRPAAWDPMLKTWWYPASVFPVVEATAAGFFEREMSGGRFVNFMATAPDFKSKTTDEQIRNKNRVEQIRLLLQQETRPELTVHMISKVINS